MYDQQKSDAEDTKAAHQGFGETTQKTIIETAKGAIAVYPHLETPLESASDFLDLMMNAGADTIALHKNDFADSFYDLKTGVAGEILQKLSNYDKRLIIIGDFSSPAKKSLRDFIFESNRTGKVVFVASLEEGIATLR
jgi:predicted Fe-Mo cluster-binding NifX family protein